MTMSLFYYISLLNYKFAFAGVRFTLGANLPESQQRISMPEMLPRSAEMSVRSPVQATAAVAAFGKVTR